jgi:hypothetical protein
MANFSASTFYDDQLIGTRSFFRKNPSLASGVSQRDALSSGQRVPQASRHQLKVQEGDNLPRQASHPSLCLVSNL